MNKMETVSVILPLYNGEKFIENTIKSVIEQDYTDLKLYIVDDQSSDNGPQIAKRYAKENPEKIIYYRMESRGGCPAVTKNVGIKLARGEYIAFIDQDDWWAKDKTTKQVDYLQKHKQVNLLGCNATIIDDKSGQNLGNYWTNPSILDTKNIRALALEAPIFATTSCILGRMSFLKQKLFDEQYSGADEYDLSLRAVIEDSKQVQVLPRVLCFWRWHSDSLSHSEQAMERTTDDEEKFYKKFIGLNILTEEEKGILTQRLWIIRKRKANSLLIRGKRNDAIKIYQDYLENTNGDKVVRIILFLDSFWPALARIIVNYKKRFSFQRPSFR